MASTLKFVTFFRQSEGYGWTEVHYRSSSSDNPNLEAQLNGFTTNIVPLRAAILAQDCAVVGVRVSYPRAGVNASLGLRFYVPGEPLATGASPSLSLAVAMHDITFTRTKIIHVRGFWDSVELNGTYRPEFSDPPNFNFRLAQWKDQLIVGGYGWLSKDPIISSKGMVTNYVVGADSMVTFTVSGDPMPAATVGTIQSVRFSRLNRSTSILNRPILVFVVDRNTLKTITQHAAVPISSQGRYNFRATSFVGYNTLGSVSLGERRMGKPLDRYPGRSKARPTA